MRSRRSVVLLALAAATPIWVGCAPEPEQREEPVILETEEIELSPDAEIDLSGDQKGAPRSSSSGQLPTDFPADLPIFQPSAISDIGDGGLGGLVQFDAQAKEPAVRDWYRSTLPRAGWTVAMSGDGAMNASKGASRVTISIESSGPGSTITVQY